MHKFQLLFTPKRMLMIGIMLGLLLFSFVPTWPTGTFAQTIPTAPSPTVEGPTSIPPVDTVQPGSTIISTPTQQAPQATATATQTSLPEWTNTIFITPTSNDLGSAGNGLYSYLIIGGLLVVGLFIILYYSRPYLGHKNKL
jgi:hypothetical protein